MYIDYENMCLKTPPELREEHPLEECTCEICRSKRAREKQLRKNKLEIYNLRNLALAYCELGTSLLKAKEMLTEGYYLLEKANNIPMKDIPNDIVFEIFEMQEIHSLKVIQSLSRSLTLDDLETYKKRSKITLTNEDLVCYLKSIISETGYFTFGAEKKSKNISTLHRILSNGRSKLVILIWFVL